MAMVGGSRQRRHQAAQQEAAEAVPAPDGVDAADQRHGEEQHDTHDADAELERGVDPQRVPAGRDVTGQQEAAQAHPAHEGPEQHAHRHGGRAHEQLQHLEPDDLVDEGGGAAPEEEEDDDLPQGSVTPAPIVALGSVPATKASIRTPGVPAGPGWPKPSTGTKTMLPGIEYSSMGLSFMASAQNSIQMGNAVWPPSASRPRPRLSFFSSKPTHTPAASAGSKPMNQPSVKSSVV